MPSKYPRLIEICDSLEANARIILKAWAAEANHLGSERAQLSIHLSRGAVVLF